MSPRGLTLVRLPLLKTDLRPNNNKPQKSTICKRNSSVSTNNKPMPLHPPRNNRANMLPMPTSRSAAFFRFLANQQCMMQQQNNAFLQTLSCLIQTPTAPQPAAKDKPTLTFQRGMVLLLLLPNRISLCPSTQ